MSSSQRSPTGEASSAPTKVLDCDDVLDLLQRLLPLNNAAVGAGQAQGESTSAAGEPSVPASTTPSTILGSQYEALAALSHAIMTAVGFRLVGLGEDDSLEASRNIGDPTEANVLPERWNVSKDSYSFRYTHSHSQLTFLIKCMRIAGKFVIHGTTLETDKICSLELEVKDYTSTSYFPLTTSIDLNRDPLWNGFISRSRINDLILEFKIKLVQQLIPGLSKPGYQEDSTTSRTTRTTAGGSTTGAGAGQGGYGRGGHEPGYYPDDPSAFPGIG
ncbi:hypothetical protein BGZ65_000645, partial [Modicella reniformis]